MLSIVLLTGYIDNDKTVCFVPSFLIQMSKFIFGHITTYVVAIDMIDIFQILRK